MRLDKYLKVSRIIKRRTVANEACDSGRVMLNDKEGKNAEKHGKIGQNSLTKNAETYINVRVQCKGPSGRLCPRVLK